MVFQTAIVALLAFIALALVKISGQISQPNESEVQR
jgi:hypothetical protein